MKAHDHLLDKPLPQKTRDVYVAVLNTSDFESIALKTGYSLDGIRKILIYGTRNIIPKNLHIYLEAVKIATKKVNRLQKELNPTNK